MSDDKILWLDLEMTGLSFETDVIIEAAAIVTDWKFNELDVYEAVVYQEQKHLNGMDSWNQKCHKKTGLYDLVSKGMKIEFVEQELVDFVKKNFSVTDSVILAGNCIYQDRNFIRKYMKKLDELLYYRMLDVTAWKIFFEREGFVFKKKNNHRALGDTRESIQEFKFYLENMSVLKKTPQPKE